MPPADMPPAETPASPAHPARRSRKLTGKVAGKVTQKVTGTVTDTVSGAGKQVRKAKDSALKEIAHARTTAERAVGAANQIITEHPMTATATAVALGALFAYAFPGTSKKIRKAAPELAQSLIDTAKSAQKALPDTDSFTKPAALAAASVGRTVRKGPELARKAAQSGLSAVKDAAMDAVIQSGLADQAGELVEKAADSLARTAKRLRTPPANREK